RRRGWRGPVWRFHRRMKVPAAAGPVIAFCGIARSAQFFQGLEAAGLRIAAREPFRDHHAYTATDLARLAKAAQSAGVTALVTTEKDRVRIGDLAGALPKEIALITASLCVEIDNPDGARSWLKQRLAARSSNRPL
ncbi:MAG: tetraacyldisaccharide 4'-kinase, partial [Terracidiphilus sp.]